MSKIRTILFNVAVALSILCVSASAIFATIKQETSRHQECKAHEECGIIWMWFNGIPITSDGYCDYFGPLCGCVLVDEFGSQSNPIYDMPGEYYCTVS